MMSISSSDAPRTSKERDTAERTVKGYFYHIRTRRGKSFKIMNISEKARPGTAGTGFYNENEMRARQRDQADFFALIYWKR